MSVCTDGWQALSGDPLPWLLDDSQPNLHWRVLRELFQRPYSSPAVSRVRGAANANEPIASLLAALHPDGRWATRTGLWTAYQGTGWRLLAAVQLGADPDDPRLQAAAAHLLETAPGEGGLAPLPGAAPSPLITARAVQALAVLGWQRHSRCQELLAWLEEGTDGPAGDWRHGPSADPAVTSRSAVCAAAVLLALASAGAGHGGQGLRPALRDSAGEYLLALFASSRGRGPRTGRRLGHPNLHRTDLAEMLLALRAVNWPYEPRLQAALRQLQGLQREGGRWATGLQLPRSLPIPTAQRPVPGSPCRWLTTRCASVLLAYAVPAQLPRRFPTKPGS